MLCKFLRNYLQLCEPQSENPKKCLGNSSGKWQWQWQVASGIRLPVAPLPSIAITLPPALSHPGRAAFLMRSGQTLLPARSHPGRGRPRRFLE